MRPMGECLFRFRTTEPGLPSGISGFAISKFSIQFKNESASLQIKKLKTMQLTACCKPWYRLGLRRTLFILKFTGIFLLAFCLNVSANELPQIAIQGKVTGI